MMKNIFGIDVISTLTLNYISMGMNSYALLNRPVGTLF